MQHLNMPLSASLLKLRPYIRTSTLQKISARLFRCGVIKNGGIGSILDSSVDRSSPHFVASKAKSMEVEGDYSQRLAVALAGGGSKAAERHTLRNKKILVRDRLEKLLDPGSDFLEFSALAGLGLEYGDVPCAGLVTGIGRVSGKLCVVIANDATVKGGTIYPITVKKQLRAQEISEMNKLPCIFLVDSGGGFLPLQADFFADRHHGGKVFFNEAVMSSMGIPQVCVVCGSCTAGAAYVPTMADETVIIDKIGTIFLGGPPLVQAATGEIVTSEELGGALMHSSVSGCTDHFAADEETALERTRDVIHSLNSDNAESPLDIEEPVCDPAELSVLASYPAEHYPIHQILAHVVDGSKFQDFKAKYGSSLITGFAKIFGHPVGILANCGQLTSEAALKGAHFVELCCQRNIPLIFLQNTTRSTTKLLDNVKNAILLKDLSKMMTAVACAQVPKITVILGGSCGPESYSMCGRSFDPRFLYTWPTARVTMETAEEMTEICCAQDAGSPEEEIMEKRNKLLKKFESESSAYFGTARLWDDGVILPQDTRKVLGMSLQAALSAPVPERSRFGVFRM